MTSVLPALMEVAELLDLPDGEFGDVRPILTLAHPVRRIISRGQAGDVTFALTLIEGAGVRELLETSRIPSTIQFPPPLPMSRNVTAILPADRDWEVWGCHGIKRCSLKSTSASIDKIDGKSGSTVFGIPIRYCRTIALLLPKSEKGLLRKMVHAQLERRGLCRNGSSDGSFECHVIEDRDDKTLVSVDVLPEPLPEELELERAKCYTAAGRAYPLPDQRAVIVAEQGRLVLCVGRDGKLLHSQVLGPSLELVEDLAIEVKLALLSLEGNGLIDKIDGVEVWGDFPPGQVAILRSHLDIRCRE